MALVLIIDDETGMRRYLRKLLENAGHEVLEAPDGERGVRAFRERSPDLVITDVFMPNKEGIQTIREIRELRPEIRVIAISGGAMGDLDLLGMVGKLGADHVIAKPFRASEIIAAVDGIAHPADYSPSI